MCDYQARNVASSSACKDTCDGCEWSSSVTTTSQGTTCVYTWTVTRANCKNQQDKTWQGTTSVPCGESTTQTFFCDGARACPGFEIDFAGDPCP